MGVGAGRRTSEQSWMVTEGEPLGNLSQASAEGSEAVSPEEEVGVRI